MRYSRNHRVALQTPTPLARVFLAKRAARSNRRSMIWPSLDPMQTGGSSSRPRSPHWQSAVLLHDQRALGVLMKIIEENVAAGLLRLHLHGTFRIGLDHLL